MGNGFVWIRHRGVLGPLLAAACLAALIALAHAAPRASAAGNTFYASPAGGGTCSQGSPCKIEVAVAKAGDGDSVSLAPGDYTLPLSGLLIEESIVIGAAPGAPARIATTDTGPVRVTEKADATLHDLRIQGPGGLLLGSGVAERVFVAFEGVKGNACELGKGTTLRNSVCWTTEVSEEEKGVSHAIDIASEGANLDEPVTLRNVTAYADTGKGNALHVEGFNGADLEVDAANVIARSVNDVDVVAEITTAGYPKSRLNIRNSSFGEFHDAAPNPDAYVTPLGTAGNIAAAPTFLNPAIGDFHVGADSPTLDGGVADLAIGAIDLDGNDRTQSKCFGAAAVPDMGAYERTATAACPPPPPPPPPPFEPRKPVFRVISLFLNRKTGGGRLLVEVPGAGTLSLTGSGVKLVRRTAPGGGGVISLPIQTWAITRVRLAKVGRTAVRLKVIFEARSGGVQQWAKRVLLRKKKTG